MHVSIVDMEVAVQQREWDRALIERRNRMQRAAIDPLVPQSRSARLADFMRRHRVAEESSEAAA